MKKSLGAKAVITPLPVLIIGTYDENGVANAMNVAWGGQCGPKHVALNLSQHKTTQNMELKKAFTCAFATRKEVAASDYVGIVSGNKVPNKVEKAVGRPHPPRRWMPPCSTNCRSRLNARSSRWRRPA